MRVSDRSSPDALLDIDFADAAGRLGSGCLWLGGARREVWQAALPAGDWQADAGLWRREAGALGVLALRLPLPASADPAGATEHAYRTLLAAARPGPRPYLIRVWNYLGAINAGEGDAERYRRFCVGRDAAVDAMFRDPPPAATAIGAPKADAPLSLLALCSAGPGIALENPRQTPAWQYPREYGPVPPGFSRGAVLRDGDTAVLLASGTASIVGHVSLHPGDVLAQLDESLANLEVLLEEGRRRAGADFHPGTLQALRVYLRDPAAMPPVAARLAARGWPLPRIAFLHGDICRRELDIELEGVFGEDR